MIRQCDDQLTLLKIHTIDNSVQTGTAPYVQLADKIASTQCPASILIKSSLQCLALTCMACPGAPHPM